VAQRVDGNRITVNHRAQTAQGRARLLLALVPLLFLSLFFVYPVVTLFAVSLAPNGVFDSSGLVTLFASRTYLQIFSFTFMQAALSTALTLLLAIPSAYVFAHWQFRGKKLLLSLSLLPFVLPTTVVAVAFSGLIGERGLVNDLLMSMFSLTEAPLQLDHTLTLVLIAHVFYNYSVALRLITGFWMNQSNHIEESAALLGAHGWGLWWQIQFPLLRPVITAAALLVFMFCFTSFGVVLIMGGQRFATIEVEIYRQATSLFNLPLAATLSLVQIGFTFILMLIYTRFQRQVIVELRSTTRPLRSATSLREKIAVVSTIVLMITLLFTPLATVILRAFTYGNEGVTLRYFGLLGTNPRGSVLFTPPLVAIGNSLSFALVTTILAVGLGVLSAYALRGSKRGLLGGLDILLMLPLVTSAVTIGFGYVVALDEPPLNLRTSIILIPIAHTLIALPFVVRNVLPALRAIPPSFGDAAQSLGASPLRVVRLIELPLILRGLLVGAVFAFTVSMGEFGASLFIARPDTPTMPIVIYRLLGQPGASNYGQALAMSVLLIIVCALSLIVIERGRTIGTSEL